VQSNPVHKVSLVWEVLFNYARLRPLVGRRDVREIAAAARRPGRLRPPEPTHAGNIWALARHLNRAVDRTLSPLPTDSRCLIQSIVLCRLLAARGVESTIVIGARSQPEFAAHAWVELQGRPVSPVLDFGDTRLAEL
jgi:hypothetical protein